MNVVQQWLQVFWQRKGQARLITAEEREAKRQAREKRLERIAARRQAREERSRKRKAARDGEPRPTREVRKEWQNHQQKERKMRDATGTLRAVTYQGDGKGGVTQIPNDLPLLPAPKVSQGNGTPTTPTTQSTTPSTPKDTNQSVQYGGQGKTDGIVGFNPTLRSIASWDTLAVHTRLTFSDASQPSDTSENDSPNLLTYTMETTTPPPAKERPVLAKSRVYKPVTTYKASTTTTTTPAANPKGESNQYVSTDFSDDDVRYWERRMNGVSASTLATAAVTRRGATTPVTSRAEELKAFHERVAARHRILDEEIANGWRGQTAIALPEQQAQRLPKTDEEREQLIEEGKQRWLAYQRALQKMLLLDFDNITALEHGAYIHYEGVDDLSIQRGLLLPLVVRDGALPTDGRALLSHFNGNTATYDAVMRRYRNGQHERRRRFDEERDEDGEGGTILDRRTGRVINIIHFRANGVEPAFFLAVEAVPGRELWRSSKHSTYGGARQEASTRFLTNLPISELLPA